MKKYIFIPALVTLLLIGVAKFYLYENENNRSTELSMLEQETLGISKDIADFINDQNQKVADFAREQTSDLTTLTESDGTEQVSEIIDLKITNKFPNNFAYIVRKNEGTYIPDLFMEQVSVKCRKDMSQFIKSYVKKKSTDETSNDYFYKPVIHPQESNYHFDIVSSWETDEGKIQSFMISFFPDSLVEILNKLKSDKHKIYLLNNKFIYLIEVSQKGARDVIERDPHLTSDELKRLYFRSPVSNTRWDIAVVVDESEYINYDKKINYWLPLFILLTWCISILALLLSKRKD